MSAATTSGAGHDDNRGCTHINIHHPTTEQEGTDRHAIMKPGPARTAIIRRTRSPQAHDKLASRVTTDPVGQFWFPRHWDQTIFLNMFPLVRLVKTKGIEPSTPALQSWWAALPEASTSINSSTTDTRTLTWTPLTSVVSCHTPCHAAGASAFQELHANPANASDGQEEADHGFESGFGCRSLSRSAGTFSTRRR